MLLFFVRYAVRSQHKMQRGLLLDVVVRQGTPVLELLPRKDESLLVRGDTLLVLDLRLDSLNRIRRLGVQRNRLACERLHENLHSIFYCRGRSLYRPQLIPLPG